MPGNEYEVTLEPAAQRDLDALTGEALKRVDKKILSLKTNPRPRKSKKLTNKDGLCRVRAGDYRVVYAVDEQQRKVRITRIKHRREVYRGDF
jgi:mRNA interferase RelE/StbE